MTNFKRKITYFYEHHKENVGSTAGFLKLEIRGDKVKINISIQEPMGLPYHGADLYFYHEAGEHLSAVYVGRVEQINGMLTYQNRTDWQNMYGLDRDLYTFDGVAVVYNDTHYYIGDFEDKSRKEYPLLLKREPVNMNNRENASGQMENEETKQSKVTINQMYRPQQQHMRNESVVDEIAGVLKTQSPEEDRKDKFLGEEDLHQRGEREQRREEGFRRERERNREREEGYPREGEWNQKREEGFRREREQNQERENEKLADTDRRTGFEHYVADKNMRIKAVDDNGIQEPQNWYENIPSSEETMHLEEQMRTKQDRGREDKNGANVSMDTTVNQQEPKGVFDKCENCPYHKKRKEQQENMGAFEKMIAEYPKLPMYGAAELFDCVRIHPRDIGKLDMRNWKLGVNSFLTHGFYTYQYLLLGKMRFDNGKERPIIGVPGVFSNRDKYLANMFGFEQFIPVKKTGTKTGEFGYWIVEIQ